MNYDDRDDDGDDNRNECGNYDDNGATGSESDGSIFDLITTHWSSGEVSGDNGNITQFK